MWGQEPKDRPQEKFGYLALGISIPLESAACSADAPLVVTFSTEIWALLALIAIGGGMAVLWTVARAYDDERKVHDLKTRVAELRANYAKRIAEMHAREAGEDLGEVDVIEVDEVPDAAPVKKAA